MDRVVPCLAADRQAPCLDQEDRVPSLACLRTVDRSSLLVVRGSIQQNHPAGSLSAATLADLHVPETLELERRHLEEAH